MKMPPEIASEVGSRLLAHDPRLRDLWAREEITLTGDELEELVRAFWFVGYGEGLSDVLDAQDGKSSALIEWAERQPA